MKLENSEIDQRLGALTGWTTDDHKWILRKYRFAEFMLGISFVNHVARIAEADNHHPMIAIDYKMVTLRLTSWHAGGLTELDFQSAARFDQAFEEVIAGSGEA
ncbi:4a-hydroxytetrahydrobiopterin dehydratase [Paenibacillus sp. CGMCC 1.16610]|uniref:4a-hydroxytetrahydrobiopterin dehydratase n=1 Tax=Paenibacillus anseongense TaxID=2682845 RepID=A0ABW9U471_9BACL|nr:4a-hydroxytetrahydrobiopterin dehydratase [Paenibacillus sp. CGMCC 1.16610]MBA2941674.1 4a-hydroxytetrahydrobiopterin dehydratase [Paenibacillus sp. CGMCC 1.16610]MVQ34193.1 4a-hydroxytetrahydrobiopterin dehydratase [Paenibacillus anseongense]